MEIVGCDVLVTVDDSIRDPEPEVVNQRRLLWILELIYSRPDVAGCKCTHLFFFLVTVGEAKPFFNACIYFSARPNYIQIAPMNSCKRAPRVLPVVTTTSETVNACRLFLFMTGAMNSNNTQPPLPLLLPGVYKQICQGASSPPQTGESFTVPLSGLTLIGTSWFDSHSDVLEVELGGGLSRVAADSEVATDNEGFAQEWFDEDFGLSRTRQEAEELRLQQLQIEQEAS
uniref:Uncharacterized protein n=1 Tax=Timema poppense TaxID=170557 RepID=A0A7R9D081_TIMPO|nr:unnamed protein product [Timema poppensis]